MEWKNTNEKELWLYCEDENRNKYVFYKGHPAFVAQFADSQACRIEGMEERFSFSDPLCRKLIAIAEAKARERFSA